ncbi:MAG TPA: HlyD family efflux transporter periplasmic adaptor subunit [Niastella sp.]
METDMDHIVPVNGTIVNNRVASRHAVVEYGNEMEEIISKRPPYFVKWGTLFFFILLILIATICRFIRYPDLVAANGRLNSINAPKEVVARTDGKLQSLSIKNNDSVTAGGILGFVESLATPSAVALVKNKTDSIYSLIVQKKENDIIRYFPDYTNQVFLRQLGELQQPFQAFMQSFIAYKDFISNGFYLRKRALLQTDVNNIQQLHGILLQQKQLLQQDISLSDETFNANESLAKDKIISSLDYRNEKSKLIAKQLSLPQINAAIVANESEQNGKRKEMAELENQVSVEKNNFIQALQTFSSHIQEWEYKYTLKAPVSGRVSFAGFLQENQQVKNGQMIFIVHPDNSSAYMEILIPQYNFGKVKPGQEVLFKFQAYPFEQFGSVRGRIEYISTMSTDSGFLAKVVLPKGLHTSYDRSLPYQNGLLAQADIITQNMSLLERFYYTLRKQVSR